MGLLAAVTAMLGRVWAMSGIPSRNRSTETWLEHRDRVVQRHPPTYDVYPDKDLPPELRLYIEGRDARGRLLREHVSLEGYSLHQINFRPGQRRGGTTVWAWFIGQVLEAQIRLTVRLDEEREKKADDAVR